MSAALCLLTRVVGSVLVVLISRTSKGVPPLCSIAGPIPPQLGQLSALLHLSLAGNELSGEENLVVLDATPFDWL